MLKRRKIAITAVLLMILYCMLFSGLTSYADEATNDPIITEAGELTIVATRSDFKIPSVVNGITVKKIVKVYALPDLTVTSVEIPDTVEEIGDEAFMNNTDSVIYGRIRLWSLNLPNSVKKIGNKAFGWNGITELTIPDSVQEIGDMAFAYNNIGKIAIPNTVQKLGKGAFEGNKIIEATVSAKNIGDDAFRFNQIQTLEITNSVEKMGKEMFAYNKLTELTLPDFFKVIPYGAFRGNEIVSLTIPNSVEKIECAAFDGNKITELTIPASVKEIEDGAFASNSIETLKFLGTVDEMGDSVFASNMIKNVELPNKLKVVPSTLFADNKLESVIIPDGVEEIGYGAFASNKNNLTDVKIPSSVKKIEDYAFGGGNKIKSATILNAKAEIGEKSFYLGKNDNDIPNIEKLYGYKWSTTEEYATKNNIPFEPLTDIEIKGIKYKIDYNTKKLTITGITSKADIEKNYPYGLSISETVDIGNEKCTVSAIADEALKDLPVKKILMPDTIETIGKKAFANNKITEMVLSEKLKSIGDNAFEDCTQLNWIYIPKSVKTIGQSLFKNNTIVKVYCYNDSVAKTSAENAGRPIYEVDKPYPGEGTGDCAVDGIVYSLNKTDKTAVVGGLKDDVTRKIFNNFNHVTIPAQIKVGYQTYKVKGVGPNAISDENIKTLTIEDEVEMLGLKAFKGCSNLKKVDMPKSMTYIDIEAFAECYKLKEINIAEGGDYTYKDDILYCKNKGEIPFANREYIFCGFLAPHTNEAGNAIREYTIDKETVSIIEPRSFANCKTIEYLEVPDHIYIVEGAFDEIKEQVVIRGYQGSYTYHYADRHGIRFECIGMSYALAFWGEYTYSFTNDEENFGNTYNIGFLRNYVENSIYESVSDDNDEWKGACFGMAATSDLFGEKLLSSSAWTDGDRYMVDPYNYSAPIENERLGYLINFYQILQRYLKKGENSIYTKMGLSLKPQALCEKLDEFYFDEVYDRIICSINSNGVNTKTHTVLIMGKPEQLSEEFKKNHNSEFSNYAYRIEIYDPDRIYASYIYISNDYTTATIGDINTVQLEGTESISSVDLYVLNEDENNVWSVEDLISKNEKVKVTSDGVTIKSKWSHPVRISNKDGMDVIIDKLSKLDGDLPCETDEVEYSNAGISDTQEEIDENRKVEILLKDEDWYKAETVNDTDPLDVSILFKDSYMTAKTKAGGKAIFENKKSVLLANPSGQEFETKLTLNDEFVTLPWYTITASGKDATELKLEMTEEGVVISGDNLENITVKGNNTEDVAELNVSTKRNKILIKADSEETNLIAYVDKDGDGTFETPLVFVEEKNLAIDDTDENTENNYESKFEKIENEESNEITKNNQTANVEKNAQTGDSIVFVVTAFIMAVVCVVFLELMYKFNM